VGESPVQTIIAQQLPSLRLPAITMPVRQTKLGLAKITEIADGALNGKK
jgi:hypothetical protein